ncbi:hypothetical protein [Propionicimonas sp.]|uniref:hypothetical protein n=1 Tax=Propionicimonas sp. TaxID=1955623 RepID=UPI003D0FFC9F
MRGEEQDVAAFVDLVTHGLGLDVTSDRTAARSACVGGITVELLLHEAEDDLPSPAECPGSLGKVSATRAAPCVEVILHLSDSEASWTLRLEELAEDDALRRRQAASLRGTIEGVASLEGIAERALREAVSARVLPAMFAGLPEPSLGFFPGEEWIGLYVEAWHRLGQPISPEWVESVDRRLEQLGSSLPLEARVQLSRALWRASVCYIAHSGRDVLDPPVFAEPDQGGPLGRADSDEDPGTNAHRAFLAAAVRGRNLVRPPYRPTAAEAVALIEHDQTQCLLNVVVEGGFARVGFRAQLKQGWIGKDFPPIFSHTERVRIADLVDAPVAAVLGERLRAMDDAWSSRRAISRTAESEASGRTALFRRGAPPDNPWPVFYVLSEALEGRRVTPRWIEGIAGRFGGWAATAAGPSDSLAAALADLQARESAAYFGLIAMAAQNGLIPTNKPHAFADR